MFIFYRNGVGTVSYAVIIKYLQFNNWNHIGEFCLDYLTQETAAPLCKWSCQRS